MKYSLSIIYIFLSIILKAQTLVLPGDYPDPSVVKIGDTYWATATTSNWAPAFPILESRDLINWTLRGHVFPELPPWADYYFWAPEITFDNGKVFVYYAAHKKDGNLCVGVASADKPEGPYIDHGPLMCEPVGSIDAFPMRDRNGKLYLIWKEDGNSVQKPTPIWAMEMNEERTKLLGEKKELFHNEAPWEANLVEGVSMMRRGEYLYAFYAGAGCCGRECSYAMGVARAKDVLGPWEKFKGNPLFKSNEKWKCPGHGTPVEKDGRFFLLYHAYSVDGDVYAGRQGVLKEFRFTGDGWIQLVGNDLPDASLPERFVDDFDDATLSASWQWSVFKKPSYTIDEQKLILTSDESASGALLGQKVLTDDYSAQVFVLGIPTNTRSGLAVIGDDNNLIALTASTNALTVWQLKDGKETIIKEVDMRMGPKIVLKIDSKDGRELFFSYSMDGKAFVSINATGVDSFYLPPWDRAVRVGVLSKGRGGLKTRFDDFSIEYLHQKK